MRPRGRLKTFQTAFLIFTELKYRMPDGGFFRYGLNHVPMFDDFTVAVETENIDDRFSPVLGGGLAEDMHEHQIAFRRDTFHFGARAGIFF